jgi:hypothetical protein
MQAPEKSSTRATTAGIPACHPALRPPCIAAASDADEAKLPTLFRFLAVIGVLAGLGYGVMFGLATFVKPEQREMSVPVPPSRFNR